MARVHDEFEGYVEHPRYGRKPRYTGLNPVTDFDAEPYVYVHWHSGEECRVPNTAIAAATHLQVDATLPVTHYFDVRRKCRDCQRRFLFFAEEQKYWYETLGFGLDSDCVRCVPCRRAHRGLERERARYEELFHVAERSVEEELEMAECSFALVAGEVFGLRQLDLVRGRLRGLEDRIDGRYRERLARVLEVLDRLRETE